MQEDDELLPPLEAAQPWRAQTGAQRARWEARQRRVAGQDTTTEDKVFQGLDHRLVDQGGQRWFDLTASSGEQQFVHQGAGILPPPTPRLHPQTAPVTAPQTFVPSGPQLVAAHTMTAAAASLRMGSCDATQHSGTPPQAPRVAGFGAAPSVVAGPDLIGIYRHVSHEQRQQQIRQVQRQIQQQSSPPPWQHFQPQQPPSMQPPPPLPPQWLPQQQQTPPSQQQQTQQGRGRGRGRGLEQRGTTWIPPPPSSPRMPPPIPMPTPLHTPPIGQLPSARAPMPPNMYQRGAKMHTPVNYEYVAKLRSVEQIRQSPGQGMGLVPEGFPRGPIAGDENNLCIEVNQWTATTSCVLGGGFHCSLGRSRSGVSQGVTRVVRCNKHESYDCKWNARFQESDEGWVLMGYTAHMAPPVDPDTGDAVGQPVVTANHHSHELIESQAELLAKKQGRTIPADALEFGRIMALSGFKTAEIDRGMRKFLSNSGGGEATWNYEDVREAFRSTAGEKELDATRLIEELETRKKGRGLEYMARTEGDRLALVFWEMEDAVDDWAQGGESNVLLFDPTCNTNKYGLKLACFTTVASTGQTVILACCLVRSENETSFEWAFRCFSDTFRVKPAIIFTDSDKAIANAVEKLCDPGQPWEGLEHLLCVFRISKNFYTHLKPLFPTSEAWHRVNSMFWRIAKDSDTHAVSRWETDWGELKELVQSNSTTSDKQAAAFKWMEYLSEKRHKWAARYVFGHCTFGIHSTQRAEAVNGAIKKTISGSMLLTEVNKSLEDYNRAARDRKTVQAHLQFLRNARRATASCAAVRSLEGKISPYAFKLVLEQEAQAMQYKTVRNDEVELQGDEMELEEGFVWVQRTSPANSTPRLCDYEAHTDRPFNFVVDDDFGLADSTRLRRTSLNSCSCQHEVAFGGLPCRHIIHRCLTDGVDEFSVELIANKWLSFDAEAMASAREALLLRAYPSSTSCARASGSATPTLNSLERFRSLMVEARSVCELARESVDTFQQVSDVMADLTRRLRRGLSVGKLDDNRTCAERGQVSTGDDEGAEDGSAPASARTTDAQEWLCSIGIMRIGCAKPSGAEFGSLKNWLIDKDVMVKWWSKGQGGWFTASVVDYDAEENKFQVSRIRSQIVLATTSLTRCAPRSDVSSSMKLTALRSGESSLQRNIRRSLLRAYSHGPY